MNKQTKIFLADDHPAFREGLIRIIEQEQNFKICDESGDGNEAIQIIRKKKPDIAVLDISMPGLSGLEILKIITNENLPTLPIILTMYTDEEYLEEAMEYGAKGYLLKLSTTKEILECIKTVLKGNFYISKELLDCLLKNKKVNAKNEILEKLSSLTPTEKQVLKLIGQNKTSVQIASELFVSFRTVQNHRYNMTHKLGLSGHNKLLLFAIEHKNLL